MNESILDTLERQQQRQKVMSDIFWNELLLTVKS
jgi:hypothetical protein